MPITKALPVPSNAIPLPSSQLAPPRNVEYSNALPVAFSLAAKPSVSPSKLVSKAPGVVGKTLD